MAGLDRYAAETAKLNDTCYALIKEYAARYATMSQGQARSLIERWTQSDRDLVQLRLKYIPNIQKVIPGKKTALFLQIDRRLGELIDVQLASDVPLVES